MRTLIIRQMDESIRYFHETYGCRIFNVSLGDPDLVYDGGKPSPWAQILNSLAHELDVLIVVSTGNLGIAGAAGADAERIASDYPRYLLEPQARILEPATAVNAMTVGALARTATPRDVKRYPNDPSIRAVANIDQPSPFTRSGHGVQASIKPDVCDYGGNLAWNGSIGRILDYDPELSVISMNKDFLARLFAADVGTSFAAPRIANLAGRLLNLYPGISANLMRALIASAAQIPAAVLEIMSEEEALRVCGYGQPDADEALFSAENRVTLFAEDALAPNSIHIYEVPIPSCLSLQTANVRSLCVWHLMLQSATREENTWV